MPVYHPYSHYICPDFAPYMTLGKLWLAIRAHTIMVRSWAKLLHGPAGWKRRSACKVRTAWPTGRTLLFKSSFVAVGKCTQVSRCFARTLVRCRSHAHTPSNFGPKLGAQCRVITGAFNSAWALFHRNRSGDVRCNCFIHAANCFRVFRHDSHAFLVFAWHRRCAFLIDIAKCFRIL